MIIIKQFSPVRNRVPHAEKAEFEICPHLEQGVMADGYTITSEGEERLVTYLCKQCYNDQYLAHQDELNICSVCTESHPNHRMRVCPDEDGEGLRYVCDDCQEEINERADNYEDDEGLDEENDD